MARNKTSASAGRDVAARLAPFRIALPATGFDLTQFDAGAKPFSLGDKTRDKAAVETLAVELDTLQNLFYADRRHKLLVVLQGLDTSGKDGTLRGVFGRMSPLGMLMASSSAALW